MSILNPMITADCMEVAFYIYKNMLAILSLTQKIVLVLYKIGLQLILFPMMQFCVLKQFVFRKNIDVKIINTK